MTAMLIIISKYALSVIMCAFVVGVGICCNTKPQTKWREIGASLLVFALYSGLGFVLLACGFMAWVAIWGPPS